MELYDIDDGFEDFMRKASPLKGHDIRYQESRKVWFASVAGFLCGIAESGCSVDEVIESVIKQLNDFRYELKVQFELPSDEEKTPDPGSRQAHKS